MKIINSSKSLRSGVEIKNELPCSVSVVYNIPTCFETIYLIVCNGEPVISDIEISRFVLYGGKWTPLKYLEKNT